MKNQYSILPEFSNINGIHIDIARERDIERIGVLSKKLIEVGLLNWVWNPQKVAEQIHNQDSLVLVAREEQELIAFVITEFKKNTANLVLLGVSSNYQRLGIGSRLVKILEQSAAALSLTSIKLEVRSENRSARTFYKKLGYKEVRVIRGYYSNHEDAIQMTHRLSYEPATFSSQ
ncbi:ribosomal protein S18-alanine N-acetyltransferase [bacterium]|nr:ribosomal protein S18-alanine N-acetyltransferase [bacterium]